MSGPWAPAELAGIATALASTRSSSNFVCQHRLGKVRRQAVRLRKGDHRERRGERIRSINNPRRSIATALCFLSRPKRATVHGPKSRFDRLNKASQPPGDPTGVTMF